MYSVALVIIVLLLLLRVSSEAKRGILYFFILFFVLLGAVLFLKPADLFFLIGLAIIMLVLVASTLAVMQKRKNTARKIVQTLVVAYVLFFALYPSIRSYMHAQRYDVLEAYLQTTYPNESLTIEFRNYRDVIQFGDFDVHHSSTSNRGVTYRVRAGGDIIQLDGSWEASRSRE